MRTNPDGKLERDGQPSWNGPKRYDEGSENVNAINQVNGGSDGARTRDLRRDRPTL
jgi:hypothetical protein